MIQTLATTCLVQSLNKACSKLPLKTNYTFHFIQLACSCNPKLQLTFQTKCNLFPPFTNAIVISHIFPATHKPFHGLISL